MPRQTSLEAFNSIKNNGLLSERRMQVYESLFHNGPMSATEIWFKYFKNLNVTQNSITPRLSELKRTGVVTEIGIQQCNVTGMNVILWDVTNKLPIKLEKKKSKDEIIKELEARIVELEKLYDVT
jgi:hypothetical protein